MKVITSIAVISLLTVSLNSWAQSRDYRSTAGSIFKENEVSVDLFGTVSVGQETIDNLSGNRVTDDGRLGAGLGVNYFLTRYVGFGADAYTEDTDHYIVDNASGNLIVRFPIESAHVAPYVYGGGGRQFDPREEWFGQVGGGVDIRVTSHWGIFTDIRYMMIDDADNVGLGRVGVRLPL